MGILILLGVAIGILTLVVETPPTPIETVPPGAPAKPPDEFAPPVLPPAPPLPPPPPPVSLEISLPGETIADALGALQDVIWGAGPAENWNDWIYYLGPRVQALTSEHFKAQTHHAMLMLVLQGYPNPAGATPGVLAGRYYLPGTSTQTNANGAGDVYRLFKMRRAQLGL